MVQSEVLLCERREAMAALFCVERQLKWPQHRQRMVVPLTMEKPRSGTPLLPTATSPAAVVVAAAAAAAAAGSLAAEHKMHQARAGGGAGTVLQGRLVGVGDDDEA